MRILLVHAHPVASSFNASLFRMSRDRLQKAGHEVDVIDLYRDGFNPVLSEAERLNYHETAINRQPVEDYVERLLAAQALVLVYPVWNYGYPAHSQRAGRPGGFLPASPSALGRRARVQPNFSTQLSRRSWCEPSLSLAVSRFRSLA